MGGSVNLRGGGQYQVPNVDGGQGYNPTYAPSGYGARFGGRGNYGGDYGMPPTFDGPGYGDFGGQYPGTSTGGKGFQQQMPMQAPVMSPFVGSPQLTYDTSTGGKGFQTPPSPSQSTAYAPMNIPRMSFAQPQFYYPTIANQMGMLGGLGGLGNMYLMPRPPMQMASYPALQPPAPQPTSTGGKGFRNRPPGTPTPPTPPVTTGGKGFQPSQPDVSRPPPAPSDNDYYNPDLNPVQPPTTLTPVAPPPFNFNNYPEYPRPIEDMAARPYSPPTGVSGPYPAYNQSEYVPEYDMPPQADYQQTPAPAYTQPDTYPRPIEEPSSPADVYVPPEEREYFPERNGDFGMETID